MASWFGPVHIAYGNISPQKTMNITEIKIAKAGGTILSKKIGIASIAMAFVTSKVHKSR